MYVTYTIRHRGEELLRIGPAPVRKGFTAHLARLAFKLGGGLRIRLSKRREGIKIER